MAARYRLSAEAQRDLVDIRDFYVQAAGIRVARQVLTEIARALHAIAATPGIGHGRIDLTDEPIKFWQVLSYLIVYDPIHAPVGVARILHARQDLATIFQQTPPQA